MLLKKGVWSAVKSSSTSRRDSRSMVAPPGPLGRKVLVRTVSGTAIAPRLGPRGQLRNPNLPGGQRTPERWFDTSAFALPAAFTFGSAPRNSVIGPGFSTTDVAFARTWSIGGREVEARWEVFNLFNRANFDVPNRIFGTPNFGRIFSAKEPREMQFGVKLTF